MTEASLIPSSGYPPATRGKLVVWGVLGGFPFGGMTWQVLHYLAGLRRLGFDVWYVEDTGVVLDRTTLEWSVTTDEIADNARYISEQVARIGLEDRWLFRAWGEGDEWHGNGDDAVAERLYGEADAILNLCGSQGEAHESAYGNCLVYVDTDPGEAQVGAARGFHGRARVLPNYSYVFTYGENVGTTVSHLPTGPVKWHHTRPPVVLDWWNQSNHRPAVDHLTTVANWSDHPEQSIEWEGETYDWRKDVLFKRFIDLPRRAALPLELALVHIDEEDRVLMGEHGWDIVDARALDDPDMYRRYIARSRGEFTVAKERYTRFRTGWFSDRSVCYLAAGRPVVTQETGFSENIPTGQGLFAFESLDEAVAAIDTIVSDYERHATYAREVAREYFSADRVLTDMLATIGLL